MNGLNSYSTQQHMTAHEAPYWTQEPVQPVEAALGYCLPNQITPQETSYYPSSDYPTDNAYGSDLFQPDEVFQLDQPIKSELSVNNNVEMTRSPPSLLDLGSGTIKYEMSETDPNFSWSQLLSEDSSSSHVTVAQKFKLDNIQSSQNYQAGVQSYGYNGEFSSHDNSYSSCNYNNNFMASNGQMQLYQSTGHETYENRFQSQETATYGYYNNVNRCQTQQYACDPIEGAQLQTQTDQLSLDYNPGGETELPPFVDYTLVGMLCSSSGGGPSQMEQNGTVDRDFQNYVAHHWNYNYYYC